MIIFCTILLFIMNLLKKNEQKLVIKNFLQKSRGRKDDEAIKSTETRIDNEAIKSTETRMHYM